MAQRNRRHIVIDSRAQAEPYTRPPRAIGGKTISHPEDRGAHAAALTQALRDADTDAREQRERLADELPRAAGIFITFESFPGVELAMESLDPRRGKRHPELLAVKSVQLAEGIREQATVYVPDGTLGYFLKRLSDYAQTSEQEKPKNRNLVDRIASPPLSSCGPTHPRSSPIRSCRHGGSSGFAARTATQSAHGSRVSPRPSAPSLAR
jgi:hypothetical protein